MTVRSRSGEQRVFLRAVLRKWGAGGQPDVYARPDDLHRAASETGKRVHEFVRDFRFSRSRTENLENV